MSAVSFPDPPRWPAAIDDPFVRAWSGAGSAEAPVALIDAYAAALQRGDDAAIAASLRHAPSAAACAAMLDALDHAVRRCAPDGVGIRLFAFPVLLVTGGRAGMRFSAVLPDVARVSAILHDSGALGRSRHFVLGNVLSSVDALREIAPSRILRLASGAEALPGGLDLPPAEIVTTGAEEEVHLRFLAAAAVTPAHAPSLAETAAAIGAWGMAVTRELGAQMQTEDASILPIPRPPVSLVLAPAIGGTAREDLALQAFVSRELRQFRSEVGEPDVRLAALASGAIGVRLSSPFIEERVRVHRRVLLPHETVDAVARGMLDLLEECRVEHAEVDSRIVDDAAFARPATGPH